MIPIKEYIKIIVDEIEEIRKVEGMVPWIRCQGMELQICGIKHKEDVIIFEGYADEQVWTKLLVSYFSGMAFAIQRKAPVVEKDFDLSKSVEKYFL